MLLDRPDQSVLYNEKKAVAQTHSWSFPLADRRGNSTLREFNSYKDLKELSHFPLWVYSVPISQVIGNWHYSFLKSYSSSAARIIWLFSNFTVYLSFQTSLCLRSLLHAHFCCPVLFHAVTRKVKPSGETEVLLRTFHFASNSLNSAIRSFNLLSSQVLAELWGDFHFYFSCSCL